MSLIDKKYPYYSLATINSDGLTAAQFLDIKNAIIERLMEIYGLNIDVSSASADGQYVYMESLIINNIYRTLENIYANLNPQTASGNALDVLYSFSNVTRFLPSYSRAYLFVKNMSGDIQEPEIITCYDRNNTVWEWVNPKDIYGDYIIRFSPYEALCLEFICKDIGPVSALGANIIGEIDWNSTENGWINRPIEFGIFKVFQNDDAEIGLDVETDNDFKKRALKMLSANSTTTQSGLEAALYSISGIKDVYILNNVSGNTFETIDLVNVLNHNVYIVIWFRDDVVIPDKTVAEIIYNKLTPGVVTNSAATCVGGENMSYEITLTSGITTKIFWKKCTATKPGIYLRFSYTDNFIKGAEFFSTYETFSIHERNIVDNCLNYLNNIKLNEVLQTSKLLYLFNSSDLTENGVIVALPCECWMLEDSSTTYLAPLTYYKYTEEDFVFNYTSETNYCEVIIADPLT